MNRFVRLSLFTRPTTRYSLVKNVHYSLLEPVIAPTIRGNSSSSSNPKKNNVILEDSMNKIEELFSAAKDELEYADESQGSIYYHEDRTTAEKAVNDVLDAYSSFLESLPSDDMRSEVKTKVDMKIRELKMTFEALPEEGH